MYRSGNGISYQGDACRDFAGGYKEIFAFSPITFAPEEDGLSYTILSPAKVAGVYETFTKALAGKGFTAFADIGTNRLASDNHRSLFGKSRFVDREGAMEIQRAAIAGSAEKLDAVMASFAAGYLLPYVSSINDVPGVSSREDGFTREIPFYSLVASQFAQLAAEPLNFAGDTQTYLLRCLEYGLQPSAYISGSDTSELWNTKANWLYAADAGEMATKLTALYRDHGDALAITGASPLVSHQRLQDGVYKSGYASGKEIYVNYTDTEAAADGLTIPAHGYRTGGAA